MLLYLQLNKILPSRAAGTHTRLAPDNILLSLKGWQVNCYQNYMLNVMHNCLVNKVLCVEFFVLKTVPSSFQILESSLLRMLPVTVSRFLKYAKNTQGHSKQSRKVVFL